MNHNGEKPVRKTMSAGANSTYSVSIDHGTQNGLKAPDTDSLGLVPDLVVGEEEGNGVRVPGMMDMIRKNSGSSPADRWRKLSIGAVSVQDDTISQCGSISSGVSSNAPTTSFYDSSRSVTCRRTLRGLQRSIPGTDTRLSNSSRPSITDETMDDAVGMGQVKATQSVADLVQSGVLPVLTVESKITSEQLERMKSRRKKETKGSRSDSISKSKKSSVKMPSKNDIDRRFNAILEALDLPEESLAQLKVCSLEKKWQMICDHSSKEEDSTHTPRFFTEKLWAVIANKNFKDTSALVKRIDVILRSTQINWLNVFLSPAVNGLNAIVSLLENMQMAIKTERSKRKHTTDEKSALAFQEANAKMERSRSRSTIKPMTRKMPSHVPPMGTPPPTRQKTLRMGRKKKTDKRVDIGELSLHFDYQTLAHDIVLLLRTMMNSEVGFMTVAEHKSAINYIAACLFDTQPKTQIVVLEMLTAVCMLENFHLHVVESMDFCRKAFREDFRFQRLVLSMKDPPQVNTNAYLISLLNFFNIIVHAAPNVNFRVHLQYDLSALGFDECLGDLLQCMDLDPLVHKQVNAYVDNFFDVQSLLENLDNPNYGKFSNTAEYQMENERLKEELQDTETRYVAKIAELEDSIRDMRRTIELLTETEQRISRQTSDESILRHNTMGQATNSSNELLSPQPTRLPRQSKTSVSSDGEDSPTLDVGTTNKTEGDKAEAAGDTSPSAKPTGAEGDATKTPESSTNTSVAGSTSAEGVAGKGDEPAQLPKPISSAPPPPILPPPPPPPDMAGGALPPPPPAFGKPPSAKRVIKSKYKMPALNWQVIRSTTWESTIFASADADFYKKWDMEAFEEKFKLKNQPNSDGGDKTPKKFTPQIVKTAKILDTNLCRNIGIIQRKLGMSGRELAEKINTYSASPDHADLLGQLLKMIPTDSEIQKLERHDKNNTTKTLADEEMFMLELYRIPRYPAKLRVMVYMLNFKDIVDFIQPQLQSVYVACSSILSSPSLKRIYELVLTIGNLSNSSRRGWTTGFQVASLDQLKTMKSTDGTMNLMNYLAKYMADKKEYSNIHNELVGLERGSNVVLSQMSSEISQLVSGLLLLRAEDKKDSSHCKDLAVFVENAKQVVPDIERLYSRAQESFGEVIVYLGETPKNQNPSEILGPLSRLVRNLLTAKKENEQSQKKAEEAAKKKDVIRAHNATAEKLNEVLKKGMSPMSKPVARDRPGNSSSFMDDMLNASKTVAYRADIKAGR
eukprot:scpid14136/ scgid20214/ Formin-like protein 1; CLL-associated antigen KW-13; Leukocyte formin